MTFHYSCSMQQLLYCVFQIIKSLQILSKMNMINLQLFVVILLVTFSPGLSCDSAALRHVLKELLGMLFIKLSIEGSIT